MTTARSDEAIHGDFIKGASFLSKVNRCVHMGTTMFACREFPRCVPVPGCGRPPIGPLALKRCIVGPVQGAIVKGIGQIHEPAGESRGTGNQ